MATSVSICSNALLLLGAQTIASFDETTDRARLAANLYDDTRRGVLRAHPWNCCVKRVALAADTVAPVFDFAYRFALPGDWLRTLQVGEDGAPVDYATEAGYLLADEDPLYLRYVFDNEAEATYDALLIEALTHAMAAAMAYPITKSASMAQLADARYQGVLRQARAVDGQDDPPQTLGDNRLLASRYTSQSWR